MRYRKFFYMAFAALTMISCGNEKSSRIPSGKTTADEETPAGLIIVAKDIVTEVVVRPDVAGDPWEVEKVAGYNGEAMINDIFESIYKGTLVVKDYHTGAVLKPSDVRSVEKEFNNDRKRIGKLSFTEDWYYDPALKSVVKRVKSVTFGYEKPDNDGKGRYNAAFVVEALR